MSAAFPTSSLQHFETLIASFHTHQRAHCHLFSLCTEDAMHSSRFVPSPLKPFSYLLSAKRPYTPIVFSKCALEISGTLPSSAFLSRPRPNYYRHDSHFASIVALSAREVLDHGQSRNTTTYYDIRWLGETCKKRNTGCGNGSAPKNHGDARSNHGEGGRG